MVWAVLTTLHKRNWSGKDSGNWPLEAAFVKNVSTVMSSFGFEGSKKPVVLYDPAVMERSDLDRVDTYSGSDMYTYPLHPNAHRLWRVLTQ